MSSIFYKLGQMAGPSVRKGMWLWQSATGDEEERAEAERQVGADLAAAFLQEMPRDPDERINAFVDEIGDRLRQCVRNKHRQFKFVVVKGHVPNAFALPGGYIFVTRGLIEMVRFGPDETAFVLGHEMGHVIKEHPAARIATDATTSAAIRAVPIAGMAGTILKSVGAKFLQSAHSRDNEFQADQLGVALGDAAGYDRSAAIQLLTQLATNVPDLQENPLFSYFSSHPPIPERIAEIRDYLERSK